MVGTLAEIVFHQKKCIQVRPGVPKTNNQCREQWRAIPGCHAGSETPNLHFQLGTGNWKFDCKLRQV